MTTPGDDEQPPTTPPDPPEPRPSGDVAGPRFGDGGTGDFSPGYDATAGSTPGAAPSGRPTPPGPPPPTTNSAPPPPPPGSAPQPTNPPPSTPTSRSADDRETRRGWIAPAIAAVVLLGGVGVLVLGRGSDDAAPEPVTTSLIAEANDPDDPIVESTVPFQTSPPLVQPTTTADPDSTTTTSTTTSTTTTSTSTTTTIAPATGGPTQIELDNALLGIDDIGEGAWVTQVPESDDDLCGTVPDAAVPEVEATSLFQEVVGEPIGVRQVTNSLFSYATPELAEQAFTADVDLLVACNATTIDLDGTQYRVEVDNDSFTAEESADFPCADQSAFLVTQLVNDQAAVPYLAQSAVAFRCGRNITLTTLTTTLAIDDLSDDAFFDAAGLSNIRVGQLPGS